MNLIERMALDFQLDAEYLFRIANRSAFYYKDYYISKRNGGERRISQASPELKSMQYWVVKNILEKLPVSDGAYAYKKGDSIKKHALLHRLSKHLFHTDIKNFFNNIHSEMLTSILLKHENIFDDLKIDITTSADEIRKICFRDNSLCIGTVSSPIISNIIMYNFDKTILDYCQSNGLIYSRYADDIYISSNSYIPSNLRDYVEIELKKYNFVMNNKKTSFISPKHCRKITGIVLTNDGSISVGTRQKNMIKKMVYDKIINKKGNSEKILGYLAFLKDVEPDTYNNIIIKYSKYCSGDIIDEIMKNNTV